MDKLETMKVFIAVAELGSFAKAADRLGFSPQLVSKYVAALEENLHTRLLHRTTRKVSLTDAGALYFQRCLQVLDDITDMEHSLLAEQVHLSGELTIAVPVSFGVRHLPKLLLDFQRQHPEIKIVLKLSDSKVDLIDEGVDLALRIGHLESSSLIARKLAPVRMGIFASSAYLSKHGTPKTPNDLKHHRYLQYSYSHANMLFSEFDVIGQDFDFPAMLVANNGDLLVNAAVEGAGIAIQPTFIASEAFANGKLEKILNGYEPKPLALYAVYLARKFLPGKIRVFIDFASQYYGEQPYWDRPFGSE
ncbi:LysR family transcriptional regulator [Enterovibrio coralii]|uniref:LysR family transcriptional regulator n=1 Tax=Enterovibrio coralii TaxID=294935 RepID=A0A135I4C1_9GAMM|nr:LysR family transcriptional regulator [Enterovibrio coralii]KXF80283.1 LysR family transcriptional regulator [Enterovibrio coralii]